LATEYAIDAIQPGGIENKGTWNRISGVKNFNLKKKKKKKKKIELDNFIRYYRLIHDNDNYTRRYANVNEWIPDKILYQEIRDTLVYVDTR
jgi:hypothetical protein